MTANSKVWSLIGVPVGIALIVSVVRLTGELWGGPQGLFGTQPGGGGSFIGIAWLIPIFGIYFGMKLTRAGQGPSSAGKAALIAVAAIVVGIVILMIGGFVLDPNGIGMLLYVGLIMSPAVILVSRMGWPELGAVLMSYGFVSRIPVVIIMLFALRGSWGTHYDALPPGFASGGWFQDWIVVGIVPQLTVWIAFTVVIGILFGALGAVIASRKTAAAVA